MDDQVTNLELPENDPRLISADDLYARLRDTRDELEWAGIDAALINETMKRLKEEMDQGIRYLPTF